MVVLKGARGLDEANNGGKRDIGRTTLLEKLRDHGYYGKSGRHELAAAIDPVGCGGRQGGRIVLASRREAADDGRIAPTVRRYASDWIALDDAKTRKRLRMALHIRAREEGRIAITQTAGIGSTASSRTSKRNDRGRSSPWMTCWNQTTPADSGARARDKGCVSVRERAREEKYGRCAYISA